MTFGTKVANGIYAGGQPRQEEFKDLRSAGFRRVIDLRPPSEDRGFNEAQAAALQGLEYVCLPIAGEADLTPAHVQQLDALLSDPAKPMTLVHCGSSNRVGALFALRSAWLGNATPEEALAVGKSAGLTSLEAAVRTAILKKPAVCR